MPCDKVFSFEIFVGHAPLLTFRSYDCQIPSSNSTSILALFSVSGFYTVFFTIINGFVETTFALLAWTVNSIEETFFFYPVKS